MMRNKKGKASLQNMLVVAALLVVIVAGGLMISDRFNGKLSIGNGSGGGTNVPFASVENLCGDAKTTTLTLNVYNGLNDTASTNYDQAYRIYQEDGSLVVTGTDTTSGTAALTCGNKYVLRLVSDDTSGDSAQIIGIRSGKSASLIENGRAVAFTANEPTMLLNLNSKLHSVLEFRAYDNNARGYMCNGDDSCTDFEADGVTLQSTVNGTEVVLGAAGEIDMTLETRATSAFTDFADTGYYILVDAATSVYNAPTVRVDGATLSNVKGTLDEKEAIAWSAYEYVYFVPVGSDRGALITDDGVDVDFRIKALSGVNPGAGDDVQIDFASRGAAARTSGGDEIRYSGVNDAASPTVIFAVQDVTIDVS